MTKTRTLETRPLRTDYGSTRAPNPSAAVRGTSAADTRIASSPMPWRCVADGVVWDEV